VSRWTRRHLRPRARPVLLDLRFGLEPRPLLRAISRRRPCSLSTDLVAGIPRRSGGIRAPGRSGAGCPTHGRARRIPTFIAARARPNPPPPRLPPCRPAAPPVTFIGVEITPPAMPQARAWTRAIRRMFPEEKPGERLHVEDEAKASARTSSRSRGPRLPVSRLRPAVPTLRRSGPACVAALEAMAAGETRVAMTPSPGGRAASAAGRGRSRQPIRGSCPGLEVGWRPEEGPRRDAARLPSPGVPDRALCEPSLKYGPAGVVVPVTRHRDLSGRSLIVASRDDPQLLLGRSDVR